MTRHFLANYQSRGLYWRSTIVLDEVSILIKRTWISPDSQVVWKNLINRIRSVITGLQEGCTLQESLTPLRRRYTESPTSSFDGSLLCSPLLHARRAGSSPPPCTPSTHLRAATNHNRANQHTGEESPSDLLQRSKVISGKKVESQQKQMAFHPFHSLEDSEWWMPFCWWSRTITDGFFFFFLFLRCCPGKDTQDSLPGWLGLLVWDLYPVGQDMEIQAENKLFWSV